MNTSLTLTSAKALVDAAAAAFSQALFADPVTDEELVSQLPERMEKTLAGPSPEATGHTYNRLAAGAAAGYLVAHAPDLDWGAAVNWAISLAEHRSSGSLHLPTDTTTELLEKLCS